MSRRERFAGRRAGMVPKTTARPQDEGPADAARLALRVLALPSWHLRFVTSGDFPACPCRPRAKAPGEVSQVAAQFALATACRHKRHGAGAHSGRGCLAEETGVFFAMLTEPWDGDRLVSRSEAGMVWCVRERSACGPCAEGRRSWPVGSVSLVVAGPSPPRFVARLAGPFGRTADESQCGCSRGLRVDAPDRPQPRRDLRCLGRRSSEGRSGDPGTCR